VTEEVRVIDEKGGQLELLPLLSTVLGISLREAKQRKQLANPCSSTMFFLTNIRLSKKTLTLTMSFLQEKVDAALNWIW